MSKYAEYGLPKLPNVISMTKVKNAIKEVGPFIICTLSNIRINGQLRRCSGFIKNAVTEKIVYINTESVLVRGKILFRSAAHEKDYAGGYNQYASASDYVTKIIRKIA